MIGCMVEVSTHTWQLCWQQERAGVDVLWRHSCNGQNHCALTEAGVFRSGSLNPVHFCTRWIRLSDCMWFHRSDWLFLSPAPAVVPLPEELEKHICLTRTKKWNYIEMKEWNELPETLSWIPGWPIHFCPLVLVINLKQYALSSFSVMLCSLRMAVLFCLSSMYSTLSLYSGYSFKLFISLSSLFIQNVSVNVYWGYVYEHDMFTVDPLRAHIDLVS